MKKFFLSTVVIVSFIGYALRGHLTQLGDDDNHVIAPPNLNTSNPITQNTNTGEVVAPTNTDSSNTNTASPAVNANVATPPPTPTPVATGKYKNGTYTGSVADAFYGNVQVKVIISGGKISDVQFLQYPNDRGHSIELNQYATPILRTEAIQAQSANVDIVSGATDTSYAFQQSLQSALSQA